jgi:2-polyprenyl-3-methyl-5-hydroxy-6-metoxy-1,4-benzoquinol methylase
MRCIVCGKEASEFALRWPDLQIVECPDCGHIFWNGELNPATISKLYSLSYFKGEEYSDYQMDRKLIQRNFAGHAKHVLHYQSGGSLLEIGSAFGYFLDLVPSSFSVTGYEICEEAAAFARDSLGLNVIGGEFLDAKIDQRFDVACMWDAIEHLERPDLVLERIRDCIRPGGYLFITTGDIGSFVARLRGPKWRLVHPPTHLHYFSRRTIKTLLSRYSFEIVKIDYQGLWRSLHQLFASVYGLRNAKRYLPGSFYLNLFDIMRVVARRTDPADPIDRTSFDVVEKSAHADRTPIDS